jgi:transposase
MTDFIQGENRNQATLFPERLDDYIAEENDVRFIDYFVDDLNKSGLGFRTEPSALGRLAYDPSMMLKLYIYGYMNRIQSSRRLERECQRNVELMWLTGKLAPDFKTIADFRKDNGEAIRLVCREFVMLCRKLKLFTNALVAIDGSKFKAVNSKDNNLTKAKLKARLRQIDQSIERYLDQLESADRHPDEFTESKHERLGEKISKLKEEMARLKQLEAPMLEHPDQQLSLTDPDSRSMATSGKGTALVGYNVQLAVDTKHHLPLCQASCHLAWQRGDRGESSVGLRNAALPHEPRLYVTVTNVGYRVLRAIPYRGRSARSGPSRCRGTVYRRIHERYAAER